MPTRHNRSIAEHVIYGDIVLERLKKAPAALKAPGSAFAKSQKALAVAGAAATKHRFVRDTALRAIGDCDMLLDEAVDELADALVASGMTKRSHAFAGFSSFSPSDMCALAFAKEVDAVRALLAKVAAKKPAAAVKAACAKCEKQAKNVTLALKALTGPQSAYAQSLADRDALLPDWQKKLATLEKHANVVFDEHPSALDALFAPPEAVQAPVTKKKKPTPKVPPAPPSLAG